MMGFIIIIVLNIWVFKENGAPLPLSDHFVVLKISLKVNLTYHDNISVSLHFCFDLFQ